MKECPIITKLILTTAIFLILWQFPVCIIHKSLIVVTATIITLFVILCICLISLFTMGPVGLVSDFLFAIFCLISIPCFINFIFYEPVFSTSLGLSPFDFVLQSKLLTPVFLSFFWVFLVEFNRQAQAKG